MNERVSRRDVLVTTSIVADSQLSALST